MTDSRQRLAAARRIVVKIGSALLTNDGQGLHVEGLDGWVAQLAALRQRGCEIVLVSSGAAFLVLPFFHGLIKTHLWLKS